MTQKEIDKLSNTLDRIDLRLANIDTLVNKLYEVVFGKDKEKDLIKNINENPKK